MEKRVYHETASYYREMLANVRYEILAQITAALEWLGGKVSLQYYHSAKNDRYILLNSGYDHIMNVPCLSGCFMFMRTAALAKYDLL